jgi:hypothetical protein
MIDALEPRRLLTFSISATAGNDLIELLPGSAQYTIDIKINGQAAGTTSDSDIRVSGLGGKRSIRDAHHAGLQPDW